MKPMSTDQSPRIIPARAGFTVSSGGLISTSGDHPRSRGVYLSTLSVEAGYRGSSPLARGLLIAAAAEDLDVGIIPARAGFTGAPDAVGSRRRDHPRSRGVYAPDGRIVAEAQGSSPLARGLRLQGGDAHAGLRIIPARAGFTPHPPHPDRRHTDHPRSRGVYAAWRPVSASRRGSSPLARGLRAG